MYRPRQVDLMHCSLIVAKAGIIILDNNWFHGNRQHQHQHQHQHTDDGISSTPSTWMKSVNYFPSANCQHLGLWIFSLSPPELIAILRQQHISARYNTDTSRATGEPLGVVATRTAQTTNLRAASLRAAATHPRRPRTVLHRLALPPSRQRLHPLHFQQAWPRTSLLTSPTKHPK